MKKNSIITVMLAIAVTAGLSACGSSGQGTAGASQSQEKQQKASSSESKEKPDTERFEEMLAENTLDKMLSRHDNVLRESEIRQSDGSRSIQSYYYDAETEFISWDKMNLCYMATPDSYVQYEMDEDKLTYLFCDGAEYYQQVFEAYQEGFPITYVDETLEKTEESDGKFMAYTSTDNEENLQEYLSVNLDDGYQKGMYSSTEYVFDLDTKDVLSIEDIIMTQDGTEYFDQAAQLRYDVESDVVDELFSDYFKGKKETRTVTLTFASGKNGEHTETFKIVPDANFIIYENGEEVQVCYTDPECTQVYQAGSSDGKDLHLYLK